MGACVWDLDLATPGIQSVPIDECHFTNQKSFSEPTYDGTLQYQPNDAVSTYASYRHGFRAGGFSTRATNAIAFRAFFPELVDEYELGLKTSSFMGDYRLTSSLAVFRQDGTDVQKQRAAPVDTDGDGQADVVATVIDNTAKQRNTGGEFEIELAGQRFGLKAYYAHTKVKILKGAAVSPIGPEIAQRGTPKHQAGLTGSFAAPVGNIGEFAAVASVSWRDDVYLDDFELSSLEPSYTLVNVRAEWNEILNSNFNVAVFATNLFDEQYRIGVLGLVAEGLGFQSSVYGEPRMYGMELTYKF